MSFPSPRGRFAVLVLAVSALLQPAAAQQRLRTPLPRIENPESHTPNLRPMMALMRTSTPIVIDGNLDDAGWIGANRATQFSETYPGDQTEPPIGIEVWMTFDDENLYVAYLIEDDPEAVRANMSDRDAIWADDYVGMMLDTYGDHAWAYFIASNPIGIQGDSRLMNGGNEDSSFDVVFSSDGQVTDQGYQVEMAIPFRSLRFPDHDVQYWNVNFWITHPRQSRSTYSWAALDRDDPCWLCQLGSISGIVGVSPGGKVELLPALTGSQSGSLASFSDPRAGLDNGRIGADPSLGIKYSFSSNLVADVAINPDFSQIEADADQIDVNSTFALNFEERRPFFQEGSDIYRTRISQVYTRSINNPSAVAKFTGRVGRLSFGYMGGLDEDSPIILPFEDQSRFAQAGRSYSNILRAMRTVGTSSYIGALVTDRRYLEHGGSGSTVGLDSRIRLSQTWTLEGQVVASQTMEQVDDELSAQVGDLTFGDGHTAAFDGESFTGLAAAVGLVKRSRHFFMQTAFRTATPTFRAANGFVTQTTMHRSEFFGGYTFYFQDHFLERLTPYVNTGYWWNYDGQRKDEFLWLGVEGRSKGQSYFQLRLLLNSNEYFRGTDFRGLRRVESSVNTTLSDKLRLGARVNFGPAIARNLEVPEKGNSFFASLSATFRPFSRLAIEPSGNVYRMTSRVTGEEFFSGYILRSRVNYQFTKRLFLRLVTQYNDFAKRFEIDPLITYKVNPFTAVYIGSTHDYQDYRLDQGYSVDGFYPTDRQIFFKLQYLFRV